MQNLVYEWVNFSKFPPIRAKIDPNLREIWKNRVILLKIWPRADWNSGSLFLEKLIFVWIDPTKTKLEHPRVAPLFCVQYPSGLSTEVLLNVAIDNQTLFWFLAIFHKTKKK